MNQNIRIITKHDVCNIAFNICEKGLRRRCLLLTQSIYISNKICLNKIIAFKIEVFFISSDHFWISRHHERIQNVRQQNKRRPLHVSKQHWWSPWLRWLEERGLRHWHKKSGTMRLMLVLLSHGVTWRSTFQGQQEISVSLRTESRRLLPERR